MRCFLALLLSVTPAAAWEFTPGLPCLLEQADPRVQVRLTHDPTLPLYSITLTRSDPWPPGDTFSIRFDGPAPLTISTIRHQIGNQGRSLTVTDRGFGNVLNGMSLNHTATAIIGGSEIPFSLSGAAAPAAAFRDCSVEPSV